MIKIKKLILLPIIMLVIFSLSGCGGSQETKVLSELKEKERKEASCPFCCDTYLCYNCNATGFVKNSYGGKDLCKYCNGSGWCNDVLQCKDAYQNETPPKSRLRYEEIIKNYEYETGNKYCNAFGHVYDYEQMAWVLPEQRRELSKEEVVQRLKELGR